MQMTTRQHLHELVDKIEEPLPDEMEVIKRLSKSVNDEDYIASDEIDWNENNI